MKDVWDYILEDDHSVRPSKSLEESMEQFKRWVDAGRLVKGHPKVVDKTEVGGAEVSTVFLGIDHGFSDNSPPIVFETMIFGGGHSQWCERYSTWEDAARHHKRIVYALENGEAPPMFEEED